MINRIKNDFVILISLHVHVLLLLLLPSSIIIYYYHFVLHVELCAAASCPLHVEVVNSSSVAETRFLALHSQTKPEFTELTCCPTSVSQPLIIHFYTSTLLLLLLSVRTLQVIHVCASTTVLCSYHNAECIMCRFISSITWTVL